MDKIELSVIVPFKDEAENLGQLNEEVVAVLSKLGIVCEIIYVDDGSNDDSDEVIKKALNGNKSENIHFKLITFKRNFGQTAAISAGIDNSKGEIISFLDADLQNDPHDLPRFLEKLTKDKDAVFGWRKDRKDKAMRSILSRFANRLINWMFSYPYHDVGCSARVVRREYVEDIKLYGELHRILPVLIYLEGANIDEIVVKHRKRQRGVSKYGFERIVKTLIDITTVRFLQSYGTKPAYVFGSMGIGSLMLTTITLLLVTYRKLFLGVYVHRDPFFLISIYFGFVGVQFIMMGLLAELQVRTYFESQKKPIYKIRSKSEY
jgi:glycosyltransferase involved in cell wall biosynthesis